MIRAHANSARRHRRGADGAAAHCASSVAPAAAPQSGLLQRTSDRPARPTQQFSASAGPLRHPAARVGFALLLSGAVIGATATSAHAQPVESLVSGYVTLTSDYRRRGLSESGGDAAVQIGGDFQHTSGFFAGAWAARIDYARPEDAGSARMKVGYYAGYSRRVARWSWVATGVRYAYPGSAYDYDYNELTATIGYRGRLFVTASYIDDLFGRGASAVHSEVGTALPLPRRLEIGAALGRVMSTDAGLEYTHWNVGLSKTFSRRIGLDLRYYDADRRYLQSPVVTADPGSWVLSATYGFGPR